MQKVEKFMKWYGIKIVISMMGWLWDSGVITYHMDFKGSGGGGGQSSPIKCIEGTIENSQPTRSGGWS